MISYYVNLKYLCNLRKLLKLLLTLDKKFKDDNITMKQAWHDEIKWFVCFLNTFGHPYPLCKYDILKHNNPFCLLRNLLYMDVIFILAFFQIS